MRAKVPHVPGGFYHSTLRGNRKQDVFRTQADYRLFEWLLNDAIRRFDAEVHAYCWMPNHVHLLVRVNEAPLFRFVQHFAARYARRFNETHDTVGHLFQGRYWAGLIDSDAYLLSTVRYIHRNPVAAGITEMAQQFAWSSHRAYLGAARTDWLSTQFILGLFEGGTVTARDQFAEFVDDAPDLDKDAFLGLVKDAEQRFEVTWHELVSRSRHANAVRARAWLAFHGMRELGMTLEDVGTRLGRSPRALSDGIAAHLSELVESAPGAQLPECSGDSLRLRG